MVSSSFSKAPELGSDGGTLGHDARAALHKGWLDRGDVNTASGFEARHKRIRSLFARSLKTGSLAVIVQSGQDLPMITTSLPLGDFSSALRPAKSSPCQFFASLTLARVD
jgi:hypothetical protein